jgi:hypothetical protein
MSYQNQPPSVPLSSQQQPQPAPPSPRFARFREWQKSWSGRVVIPIVALCVGIMLGIGAVLLYGLTSEGQIVVAPTPAKGNIVVEIDKAFLTQLVTMNLRDSGLPGQIENVQVDLSRDDEITVNGDDVFSVLGIGVARHFMFVAQPYVNSCFLQVHIVHADFSNIPVTGFAHIFESHINQQLRMKPEGLPTGFQYCTTGVRTEPSGMFVTYTAKPT